MTNAKDPIATLRRLWIDGGEPGDYSDLALAELERRARIEARRDAFLDDCRVVEIRHFIDVGMHTVHIQGLGYTRLVSASGPDYHIALEAALNAAGAP